MFRKMLAIVLCLLLLLCVGCADVAEKTNPATEGSTEPTQNEPTTEPTQLTEEPTDSEPSETEEVTEPPMEEPTEEVFAPIDAENPVVEAFAGEYNGSGTYVYHYSIPQIQCESSYAQTVNEELSGFYNDYIDGTGYYGGNKSFDWYVNGDVLSLVVYHYDKESPTDYEAHLRNSIYNLRMSDGSQVTDEEILKIAGVTVEDFRARARQILGNAYIIKSLPPEEAEAIYNKLLASREEGQKAWQYEFFCKCVSDENLDLIEMFLGENGTLCFTCRRYYVAGGFEYCTPLFDYFADFEVSPYAETFFANVP